MQFIIQSKRIRRAVFLLAALLVCSCFAEAQTKRPKTKTAAKAAADKIAYAPDADLLNELRDQIRVVESKKDWARFNRQSPATNKTASRSAYVAQFAIDADAENTIDVIVVYDKTADKYYEIRGFDFPRPFENLRWTSDDVLQFDQWVNPSRGGRYAVNLKTGNLVAAGYIEDK